MTTTDNAAPSGSDSLRFVWIALRVAGGTLGVLTLLKIATIGLGVEYKVFFQDVLDRLKDWIDLAPLLDPIEKYVVHPTLDWFRSFGWTIPKLGEHWRYIFSLTWLLMLAVARNFPLGGGIIWQVICAVVFALLAAVATGTAPLDSFAVFVWPGASCALWLAVVHLPAALRGRGWWSAVTFLLLFAAGFAFLGYFGPPIKSDFFVEIPSPGLLGLAIVVGGTGVFTLVLGLLWHELGRRWINPYTATGLDIVGVMGAALFIGWIMLK